MVKYRIHPLAELARQMQFTPTDTRCHQLAAAEELLLTLDPNKAYPFEYVVFRITGYHPKTAGPDLYTGMALQHDLGVLTEQISDSLDIVAARLSEPVLQIDDVCERFNVTSKTIQRWRRRGLPARRMIFDDGKRRVGFLLSVVERFLSLHQSQVCEAGNFSQVGDAERAEMIRRAKRLSAQCGCCRNEIIRRIAKRLNRSPLTVLHTIRKHDAEHPEDSVLPTAREPISESDRAAILRANRHGISIARLARRYCRPATAIYRVLLEERIDRLNRRKIKFIDDPLYHHPDAAPLIDDLVNTESLAPASAIEQSRIPKDLPAYLQDLYRTPLLTPARERALFLKFNYHKFQFAMARRRLDPQMARARELNELERHLRDAIDTRNQIVQANLRLVVSVARKHLRPGMSLMELVSEGNLTLMRAVESFDTHKGNRFSTYATLSLMKGFARSVPMLQARTRGVAGLDEDGLAGIADRAHAQDRRVLLRDEVRALVRRLEPREREVVLRHFGVALDGADLAPASFEELAETLGLSKQRIRQIEQAAMEKLRTLAR